MRVEASRSRTDCRPARAGGNLHYMRFTRCVERYADQTADTFVESRSCANSSSSLLALLGIDRSPLESLFP